MAGSQSPVLVHVGDPDGGRRGRLLCGLFIGIGIRLVDFKLEFGRIWNLHRMLEAAEEYPMNLGFLGKGNCSTPGPLREQVLAERADVGLAFDGDGDRLIVVDETGVELSGDHILAICVKDLKERGELKGNLAVGTVMSNFGLHATMRNLGVEFGCSAVGDRYVMEMMNERGGIIGAEPSGHMIFLDKHTTGDGIVSALQLLAVIRRTGEEVSALASVLKMSPQHLINVDVASRPPLKDLPGVQMVIAAAEKELGQDGRVLVRYSGTQNMCRVMVEGPTEEMTIRLCDSIAAALQKEIG